METPMEVGEERTVTPPPASPIGEVDKQEANLDEEGDGDSDSYDSEEDSSDGEDGAEEGKRWLNVKDLRNMSLQEVKVLLADENNSTSGSAPNRKIDQPITKVIVRRLPPQITVEGYLKELEEVPKYNYIRLVSQPTDYPSRIGRRTSIYINFDKEEEALWFKEKYNNMAFYDDSGSDYISCVDFSLVQETAVDPEPHRLSGTLEDSCEDYKKFLAKYEEDPTLYNSVRPDVVLTPEAMLDQILHKPPGEGENTPLLQFLRRRSEREENDRKEREHRRRERDAERKRQKEESAKRRQKEKDEAKQRDTKLKENDDTNKRDKQNQKERRRERDRERQRERDKERRLRRERERAAAAEKSNQSGNQGGASTSDKKDIDKPAKTQEPFPRNDNEKDAKFSKPFPNSGTITYSKSGNPTRWSENSGPRKNDKRNQNESSNNRPQDPKPSGSAEASSSQNSDKTEGTAPKNPFGKPFPIRDSQPVAATKSASDKGSATHKSEVSEEAHKETGSAAAQSSEGGGGGSTRKKIVKKVIRVRKVVKEKEDGTGGEPSDNNDSKPKKFVRVVKKSSKPDNVSDGSSSKPFPEASKSQESVSASSSKGGGDASASDQGSKAESDKDRKNRKGRPEIQIYRPGSLRGGGGKQSGSRNQGDKEKDRSNDNVSKS